MANTRTVTHYGIHWDEDGLAWLQQGRGGTNAWGVKEKSSFSVKLPNRSVHCNHMVQLASAVPNDHHWNTFVQLLDDPLVRAFLPTPKQDGGVYFLESMGPNEHLILIMLSKLSSPIYNVVAPMWTMTPSTIIEQLQQTNIQPFVVTDLKPKDSETIGQLSRAAVYHPRKLIMVGSSDVVINANIRRVKTKLHTDHNLGDLVSLPWESLGASIVRLFMRRELNENPQGSYADLRKTSSPRGTT